MFTAINKYLTVSADAIYGAENGIPFSEPSANDVDVTLPAIGHPVTTVNMMGSVDIADETRVDNIQITISCQTNVETARLLNTREFIIKYAMQKQDAQTGLVSYVGFTAYAYGTPQSFSGGSHNVGETGASDITINCLKYRLQEEGKDIIEIDRMAGILKINGVDKRAEINKLL